MFIKCMEQIRIVASGDDIEIVQGNTLDNAFIPTFVWKEKISVKEYTHPWQDFLVISSDKRKKLTIRMIECRNFSYYIEALDIELIDFMSECDVEITGCLSPSTVKAENIIVRNDYITGLDIRGHYECDTFRVVLASYKLCLRTTIYCKNMVIDVRCCDILMGQVADVILNCETFNIKADITKMLTINISKAITANMVKRTNELGFVSHDRVIEPINISGSLDIVSTIKDKSSSTIFKGITADKGIRIDFHKFIYLEGDK